MAKAAACEYEAVKKQVTIGHYVQITDSIEKVVDTGLLNWRVSGGFN